MKLKKIKEHKLDKKNKLIIFTNNDKFIVYSRIKTWLGWRNSEYALDYQTDLTGQKIIEGEYKSFSTLDMATKWMNFLSSRFKKRVKFIG